MRTLRVRELRWEAEDVLSVRLEDPAGEPLPAWAPGAHLDLGLREGLVRQYSLCGDPADASHWRVAVLREADGRGGSAFVHDELRPGALLEVDGPRNHFALVDAQRYVFIAGGVGITPIRPMVAEAQARGADWRLVYGGRRRASMAFADELAALGDRVELCPQDEHGLLDLDGLLGTPQAGTAIFCCGPAPLLDAVTERCASWPEGALHLERFEPVISAKEAVSGAAFSVKLAKSGVTIEVPDGQSILGAIEAEGILLACSCLEGTCGTCETTVLAGVPDHRDSILTPAEREAGETMMICVSRSRTPVLELDL